MRVLLVFECFFRFFIFTSSSTCNWKMLRGHVDQGSLQRRPKMTQQRQNLRPKMKHQRSTKHSGARANGPGWIDPTTGCPWGPPRPVVGGARPCAPGACGFFRFLSQLFVFGGFCCFSPYDVSASRHLGRANPFHNILHSIFLELE